MTRNRIELIHPRRGIAKIRIKLQEQLDSFENEITEEQLLSIFKDYPNLVIIVISTTKIIQRFRVLRQVQFIWFNHKVTKTIMRDHTQNQIKIEARQLAEAEFKRAIRIRIGLESE
jgi:hypothetical protein